MIPVDCEGFPLRLSTVAFGSDDQRSHLLSWVSMGLFLFGFAKSIDLGLIPSKVVFWHSAVMNGTDGEGWGRGITFVLYPGSHTHISKTKFFNQNSTFKSVKLLGISEKERALTKFREL